MYNGGVGYDEYYQLPKVNVMKWFMCLLVFFVIVLPFTFFIWAARL